MDGYQRAGGWGEGVKGVKWIKNTLIPTGTEQCIELWTPYIVHPKLI